MIMVDRVSFDRRVKASYAPFFNGSYQSASASEKAQMKSDLFDMFSHSTWESMTAEQKKDCCQALSNYYADSFGIPPVSVIPGKMKDYCYGGWNGSYIKLNKNLFENGTVISNPPDGITDDSNMQLFDTIVHETRHAYQTWAMEHPDEFISRAENKAEARRLLSEWSLNGGRYYPDSNSDRYYTQPLERDAWEFAHKETEKAFEEIEPRNGQEPAAVRVYYEYSWYNSNPERRLNNALEQDPEFQNKMYSEMRDGCEAKGIKYDYDSELSNSESVPDDMQEMSQDTDTESPPSQDDSVSEAEHPEEQESGEENAVSADIEDGYEESSEPAAAEEPSTEDTPEETSDQELSSGEDGLTGEIPSEETGEVPSDSEEIDDGYLEIPHEEEAEEIDDGYLEIAHGEKSEAIQTETGHSSEESSQSDELSSDEQQEHEQNVPSEIESLNIREGEENAQGNAEPSPSGNQEQAQPETTEGQSAEDEMSQLQGSLPAENMNTELQAEIESQNTSEDAAPVRGEAESEPTENVGIASAEDEMSQLQGNSSPENINGESEMDSISRPDPASAPETENEMESLSAPAETSVPPADSGSSSDTSSQGNEEDNEYSY